MAHAGRTLALSRTVRRAALALLALSAAARAQELGAASRADEALAALRDPLDVARREHALRRLLRGDGAAERLSAVASDSLASADARRLALRGLALLEGEAAAARWCDLARGGPRRARREAALRLAFDASSAGSDALRSLALDDYDDVRAAALGALRARAGAHESGGGLAPGSYAPLARAWVTLLPWHDGRACAPLAGLVDRQLAEELYRRIAREGLPARCTAEELGAALGAGPHAVFDRRRAIAFLVGAAAAEVDLFAPLFESEEGADALGELDRAILLRCVHAGARLLRPVERMRQATRDRIAWLLPVWPWLVARAEREQILREHTNGALAEELAQILPQDPELELYADRTLLELYTGARSAAVRGHLLRAALRLPTRFELVLAHAVHDEEPLLREPAIGWAIERAAFELAIDSAERETSPVVQVRVASRLGAALERAGRGSEARVLALRWAGSAESATRRLALHMLRALEPDESALRAARELWTRTPLADGERSDVHALLARFPGARAEVLAGLAELSAADAGRARDRVAELSLRALALRAEEEQGFALPVRGELACRRAQRGEAAAAAFLRESFDALPEELALRALDAIAAVPEAESWRFLERLREAGRFDADVLLEAAAPLRALPEVELALRSALRAEDPQLRQAALRGLGRAGAEGQRVLRALGRTEFSSGDLTAWIEALDASPESTTALADAVADACASSILGGEDRVRPELSRALLRLVERGDDGDRALEGALARALARGALDGIATHALRVLVAALEERAPRAARRIAAWALATGEPDAELVHRTALVLAADPERSRASALAHLSLWLAARDELETSSALAARERTELDLAESSQLAVHARALELLATIDPELERGAIEEARARFEHALAASFFDVRARAAVQAFGAARAPLRERAEKELRRWREVGYAAAPSASNGPLSGLEARIVAPR